jgi:hypothetical protein
MITDPPYGIELDSEWRDRAGLNGCGPAESSYMKPAPRATPKRPSPGTHAPTGRKPLNWCRVFRSCTCGTPPSSRVKFLDGLLRIGFLYPQQIIWNKGRVVLTRTHCWYQHEPCWYVRKKNAPWFGKAGENSTIWD